MKTIVCVLVLIPLSMVCSAQSIVGRWQLVKESSCVEDELSPDDAETEELVNDMKSMSGAKPQVLEFKENNTGNESTKIISRKKSYNSKGFLYRFDGEGLYFLDKKSKTIIEGFTVERFEADSLIITNSNRVCETKIFVRIK
ncbi:MAG TPA: hypothetical protein VF141_21715 [Chryseolinea sp.]